MEAARSIKRILKMFTPQTVPRKQFSKLVDNTQNWLITLNLKKRMKIIYRNVLIHPKLSENYQKTLTSLLLTFFST